MRCAIRHGPAEIIWPAETFRVEGGELVDVLRPSGTEKGLENRIRQNAAVKDVDELLQRLIATGVLI